MNVVLVAQCTKQALKESRRILDQFAERRGERTWQTSITSAGLDTLRKLLRKTARKNTAVACHWVRAKDHTELLWVVGNASHFNEAGAVPTDSTQRDMMRASDENNWHKLSYMGLLCGLASLLHDLGKASQAFQQRLRAGSLPEKNRYRHEWVSVRLWQAFVGSDSDEEWLAKLVRFGAADACGHEFERLWLGSENRPLWRDGVDARASLSKPFECPPLGLPPLAQTIAWLVLTHHRLPARHDIDSYEETSLMWYGKQPNSVPRTLLPFLLQQVDADWNEPWCKHGRETPDPVPYWQFPFGLPVRTELWRARAARMAKALSRHAADWSQGLADPYVMHVSRMSLMLADHYYSSLKKPEVRVKGELKFPLYANTDRATGKLLQPLDEHLLGVEHHAAKVIRALPGLRTSLPHLLKHKGLRKRSKNARFRWQDKAADMAEGIRPYMVEHGVFIVNMASTGCGKTLGNARVMNALSLPNQGLRCAFAMGLRTLTLQTGRSFQKNLQLGDEELAIQVGGAAQKDLFTYYEQLAEQSGSASTQDLLDEAGHIVYDTDVNHPVLQQLANSSGAQKLLQAPLLVCTVDHLTPATESLRGGRQIAPMLRLLSSDLVLDEPDDFDLADLPALTRLVHWAGLLGTRVLLSSATLTPALVQGLFLAYQAGRQWYQRNRGARPDESAQVSAMWIDEFDQSYALAVSDQDFERHHQAFVERRSKHLTALSRRQWAHIINSPKSEPGVDRSQYRTQLAELFLSRALALHKAHHSVDPHSGKQVSFGLIRMANINPLYEVALAMCQLGVKAEDVQIHLCVYHSQYPLAMRSAIEANLDQVLNRQDENAVFDLPQVQYRLHRSAAQHHVFIVLGSPVTEVGRDHDYDWAIVEPSSMRSIIQLAGRVLRHRPLKQANAPNIYLCNYNVRHADNVARQKSSEVSKSPKQAAFCRPGFEAKDRYLLDYHDLASLLKPLLDAKNCFVINAQPRIQAPAASARRPHQDLVDLEHYRLELEMLPVIAQHVSPEKTVSENASLFWHVPTMHLMGFAQQRQPFREQTLAQIELAFLPDEDEESLLLHRVAEGKRANENLYVLINHSLCHEVQISMHESVDFWGSEDLVDLLVRQAEVMDLSLQQCAVRFGTVTLPDSQQGWCWHPNLGFRKASA